MWYIRFFFYEEIVVKFGFNNQQFKPEAIYLFIYIFLRIA